MPLETGSREERLVWYGTLYHCEDCGKGFPSNSQLTYHVKRVHKQEELPHKCLVCDKRFLFGNGLTKHMVVHIEEKPHKCPHCPLAFRLIYALNGHVRTVHLKERRFKCDQCPMAFARSTQLRSHLRFHLKRYKCEFCELEFEQKGLLNDHLQTVHWKEKRFKCDICSRGFTRKWSLVTHNSNFHSKNKPQSWMEKINALISSNSVDPQNTSFDSEVDKVVVEIEDITGFVVKNEPVEEVIEINEGSHDQQL